MTTFYEQIQSATRTEQEQLFRIPFVAAAVQGALTRPEYIAFLTQAYHHVKHTVPLLLAARDALPERCRWMAAELDTYVDEETGHEQWILDDIAACGGDAESVRRGEPDMPCEVMVAHAYDLIARRNPAGFFGMVHVLEGASVRGATTAAHALQAHLGLPDAAFTYLTTHGDLDTDHVQFFESIVNRVDDEGDRRMIEHCSKVFFSLYGNIFRALSPRETRATTQEVGTCN